MRLWRGCEVWVNTKPAGEGTNVIGHLLRSMGEFRLCQAGIVPGMLLAMNGILVLVQRNCDGYTFKCEVSFGACARELQWACFVSCFNGPRDTRLCGMSPFALFW